MAQKIVKKVGEQVTAIEENVAQALSDLENSKDWSDLKELYISSVKEIEVVAGKKALAIFVPFRLHKRFQKIIPKLIRELEKKFNNRHVVFIAQRTILSKSYSRSHPGQTRARSRTLTAVHEAILNDIVYPTLIVGKRTRVRLDGSRQIKVFLDPKDSLHIDNKLKTFAAVYKKLTSKSVEFVFPSQQE
eukprot:TRINITY_DN1958_c0_g1_i2.p2 TRINITY_DN1958_c0_g1~~TRINITY_DN1958_c0_g1_i2.p2  ORF type:complete len:199 (-),score=94.28 TRINITY_DN1958_c0_g1_i2:106-672(-)